MALKRINKVSYGERKFESAALVLYDIVHMRIMCVKYLSRRSEIAVVSLNSWAHVNVLFSVVFYYLSMSLPE